jgi:hypothetical protein
MMNLEWKWEEAVMAYFTFFIITIIVSGSTVLVMT